MISEILGFGLFFLTVAIEWIAMARWNRTYFSTGLILFRSEASASSPGADLPDTSLLQVRLDDSHLTPMLFRRVGTDVIAFREAAWGGWRRASYTPVMRGTITFDRHGSKVIVRGRLNWFHLVFLLAIGLATVSWGFPWFLLVAGLFYAVLYRIQFRRYRQIAGLAAAAWSASYVQGS